MIKKLTVFLILVIGIASSVFASEPDWSVNPAEYKSNMTITGVINFYGEESADSNDLVGAFANGICRGVGSPIYVVEMDRWMVFLLVFGNESFDTLSFRLYDESSDEIYDCEKNMVFEMNGIVGDPMSPYVWSYPTLSSEAAFIEFSLEGQLRETIITDTLIRIVMPSGTDLTSLVANFTADTGNYVSVNGLLQESGITVNDFSEPVIYTILSADESITRYYTVLVTIEQAVEAANFFSPNGDLINDTWMIKDPELYENCEFIIFDAMGVKVFEQTGYNNDWDGKYKGNKLPDGTYYFIIRCEDVDYKGSITLLR